MESGNPSSTPVSNKASFKINQNVRDYSLTDAQYLFNGLDSILFLASTFFGRFLPGIAELSIDQGHGTNGDSHYE